MAIPGQEQLDSLLLLLRGGNAEALDGIWACIGGRMFALARGVRGYKSGTNGCAFVMRIVRNCAFDLLRRRKVRAEEDIDAFFHLTDERYNARQIERALVLEDAVGRLTPEERRMIYYRYYLDLTVREIARETGLSKSAVQRQVASAEENLRKMLSEGQKGE